MRSISHRWLAGTAVLSIVAVGGIAPAVAQDGEPVTLTMGSFRTDDIDAWNAIIPLFEAEHPEIKVVFDPTNNEEYNSQIRAQLEGGVGPDLITCRTFDLSQDLFKSGYLADLSHLPGMQESFTPFARTSWSTDDGAQSYCVPLAATIHGFVYNADLFEELGLEPPETESEFFAVLDTIKEQRPEVAGIALTTLTTWPADIMGWDTLWPTFTAGEETRQALMAGDLDVLTSPDMVAAMTSLDGWRDYMPAGYQSLGYPDMQQLFTLGQAAIYPAMSVEIPLFQEQAAFEMGAFKPYVPDTRDPEDCHIINRSDFGVGLNANSENADAARTFLEWLTTAEFSQAYTDNLPGQFTMSSHPVDIADPLAAEYGSWRDRCGSTELLTAQFLSRGEPSGIQLQIDNAALMMNGEITPESAVEAVRDGLATWYEPPTE
jgi:raffinose/stachyose/melibiose transport system substrate-binding protein